MRSETFDNEEDEVIPKRKHLVRMIVNMLLTGSLQGCDRGMESSTWAGSMAWIGILAGAVVTLLATVYYLYAQLFKVQVQLDKYQTI